MVMDEEIIDDFDDELDAEMQRQGEAWDGMVNAWEMAGFEH